MPTKRKVHGGAVDAYGLTPEDNAEYWRRFRTDGVDPANQWRSVLRAQRAKEVNAAAEAGQAERTRASAKANADAHEARMRALYPDWDQLTEDTKRAVANAPFAKKQGELSGSAFAKAIIEGVNDPILRQGIEVAATFLAEGGKAAALALLKNPTDLKGAISAIIKKAAPGIAYAFTASHKNLTPAAEAVRQIAQKIAGDGIVADVYHFFTGKYQGEKKLESFLKKHGEARIQSIRLFREPVKGALQRIVNWATKGDLEKQMDKNAYDKLFHLSMLIELSDGSTVTLEKNSSITTHAGKLQYGVEAQSMDVPLSKHPEMREFIYNAIQRAGLQGFFVYDPFGKNCQDFIYNALKANGLLTPTVGDWIRQNLQDVATKHPAAAKLFQAITDIHGVVSGSGADAEGVSSDDLDIHLRRLKGYIGSFAKDMLPKTLRAGQSLIVNLGTAQSGGTHWCAVAVRDGKVYYFDPYGGFPDPAVQALARRRPLLASTLQYQKLGSTACGPFCAYFLSRLGAGADLYTVLYDDLDPSPTARNERTVLKAFK